MFQAEYEIENYAVGLLNATGTLTVDLEDGQISLIRAVLSTEEWNNEIGAWEETFHAVDARSDGFSKAAFLKLADAVEDDKAILDFVIDQYREAA